MKKPDGRWTLSQMKILIVTMGLTAAGGAERLVVEEAVHLRERGHNVLIACSHFKETALFGHRSLDLVAFGETAGRWGLSLAKAAWRIRRIIRAYKPDIVIAHYCDVETCLALLGKKIPYFLHINSSPFWFQNSNELYAHYGSNKFWMIMNSIPGHREFHSLEKPRWAQRTKSRIYSKLRKIAIHRSTGVVTISNQAQWELKLLYDKEAKVIRPGVDVYWEKRLKKNSNTRQRLGLPDGQIIFSVSRLDPRKRIGLLIKAYAKLREEMEAVFLVIGGTGQEMKSLKRMAYELGLQDSVSFVGFIPESLLPDYYSACDVFAMPAWCAYGLTPLEALAFGKKCVISRDSMVTEILEEVEGVWIVEPNVAEFKQALKEALQAPNQGSIPPILKELTWNKFTEELERYITMELLSECR